MRADPDFPPRPFTPSVPNIRARRPARSLTDKLQATLLMLADGHGAIARHVERSWASVTFAGTRHTLDIVYSSTQAIAGGERLLAALPDHEFTIPGQLVADATVVEAQHTLLPEARLAVTVELLLLEES